MSTGWRVLARRPSGVSGQRQRGLSLVELMIAMALSMFIVLALAEMYVNMSRSNQELSKTSIQIENARYATQFLEYDLFHAGYWGGFVPEFDDLSRLNVPTDTPTAIPDPCLAYTTPWTTAHIDALIGIPVQVESDIPGTCGGIVLNKLADTDVLVIRRVETCVPGVGNCDADVSGELYFQASNCMLELSAGQTYSLDPASYTLRERNCDNTGAGTIAAKRKFMQSIYYVRDYAITAGDGIPTLMRSDFGLSGGVLAQQPAQALVEGIERFRVELGVDSLSDSSEAVDYTAAIVWSDPEDHHSPRNRGDGVPESFIHCGTGCTLAQLIDTVAVRLHLLVRATESTAGYVDTKDYVLGGTTVNASVLDDSFKRHAFSTTARLYNVSGRRETPEG
jgi:type IV pilus assembly protein PilW